jgi:Type II secretion system (T2SS), protein E, N-terminal domain
MKDILESAHIDPIPQLSVIRRVQMRYRQILPLVFMKQYQCIVVGAAPGILTVAVTDRHNMAVIESLSRYNRQAIFPVLIEPKRMRLLIQRIERCEQCRRIFYSKGKQAKEIECYLYAQRRLQVGSILMLVTSQKTRDL